MVSQASILVVEDDADIRYLIGTYLQQAQLHVRTAANGKAMMAALKEVPADLIILDIMLPGQSGMELCRNLRADSRYSRVPIIMLTARTSIADRVEGLELGADDYLAKPFEPVELLARIKAVLRRASSAPVVVAPPTAAPDIAVEDWEEAAVIYFGAWQLNNRARQLRAPDGTLISLATSDARMLQLMLSQSPVAVSRDRLLAYAFGRQRHANDRTVDVCISRLRGYLEVDSRQPLWIVTIRHEGYMYNGPRPQMHAPEE